MTTKTDATSDEREQYIRGDYKDRIAEWHKDDLEFLLNLLDKERQAAKVLEDALRAECFCERLHPDIGGSCGFCETLKLAKQIREGLK